MTGYLDVLFVFRSGDGGSFCGLVMVVVVFIGEIGVSEEVGILLVD